MVSRRGPTDASRATARRIADALADLLIDDPLSPAHPRASPNADARRCPSCGGGFEAVQRDAQVEVELCVDCGGIWLDRGELHEVLAPSRNEAAPAPPDPKALRQRVREVLGGPRDVEYRSCPVCAQTMARENFATSSGVLIDRCRRHGVYLDRGELEAIVAFVRGGGLEHAQRLEHAQGQEAQRRTQWRDRQRKRDRDQAARERIRARMRRALL